jgi:beta-lactamase superfamily II metal-dependent hydrolase
VATNGQPHTTGIYEAFLDAIAESGAEYREVGRGDKLNAGSLEFGVLHPGHTSGDLNNDSLVLRLQHGSVAFLFTGDVQTEGEASMLWGGMLVRADVLKVSHHGSSSSSSVSFVSAVAPKIAVISCGAGNSYGHPHGETLATLQHVGADVYRTDQVGSVIVTSDGSTYRVATSLPQPRAPPTTATTLVAPEPTAAPPAQSCPYIGNSNTGKFHRAGCRYVAQMSPANKVCLQSREQAISLGYVPCKVCAP